MGGTCSVCCRRDRGIGDACDHIEVGEMEELDEHALQGMSRHSSVKSGRGTSEWTQHHQLPHAHTHNASLPTQPCAKATPLARPSRPQSIIRNKEAQQQLQSALLDNYNQTPVISHQHDDVEFESCISLQSFSTTTGLLQDDHHRQTFPPPSPPAQPTCIETPAAKPAPTPLFGQLPSGFASFDTKKKCKSKLLTQWRYLDSEENMQHLREGGSLYNFICATGDQLPSDAKEMMSTFISSSCFADGKQRTEIDMTCPEELKNHVFIFNKAFYCMPAPIKIQRLTPEVLSTVVYQRSCQPRNPKIWNDVTDKNTFRFTKSIIPFIYSITVQFKVSEVPREVWPEYSEMLFEGYEIHNALLLERTKRDVNYKDSTKTVKSLLLFHIPACGEGALVASITAIGNTSLPKIVAGVVDTFGSSGAVEVSETADLTRKHLLKTMV